MKHIAHFKYVFILLVTLFSVSQAYHSIESLHIANTPYLLLADSLNLVIVKDNGSSSQEISRLTRAEAIYTIEKYPTKESLVAVALDDKILLLDIGNTGIISIKDSVSLSFSATSLAWDQDTLYATAGTKLARLHKNIGNKVSKIWEKLLPRPFHKIQSYQGHIYGNDYGMALIASVSVSGIGNVVAMHPIDGVGTVSVENGYLYFSSGNSSLQVYALDKPQRPILVSSPHSRVHVWGEKLIKNGLIFYGNQPYGDKDGWRYLDIRDRAKPKYIQLKSSSKISSFSKVLAFNRETSTGYFEDNLKKIYAVSFDPVKDTLILKWQSTSLTRTGYPKLLSIPSDSSNIEVKKILAFDNEQGTRMGVTCYPVSCEPVNDLLEVDIRYVLKAPSYKGVVTGFNFWLDTLSVRNGQFYQSSFSGIDKGYAGKYNGEGYIAIHGSKKIITLDKKSKIHNFQWKISEGYCNEIKEPNVLESKTCSEINLSQYNSSYCENPNNHQNVDRRIHSIFNTFRNQEQIQIPSTTASFTLRGETRKFNAGTMNSPMYWMALTLAQEMRKVDWRILAGLGAYQSFAGLSDLKGNSQYAPDHDNVGSVYSSAFHRNKSNYGDYSSENKSNTLSNGPEHGLAASEVADDLENVFSIYYGAGNYNLPTFLEKSKDRWLGAKLATIYFYNGWNSNVIENVLKSIDFNDTNSTDISEYLYKTPWGKQFPYYTPLGYIKEPVKVMEAIEASQKQLKNCGGNTPIYDAEVSLIDIQKIIFGTNGSPTIKSSQANVMKNDSLTNRQVLWDEITCVFNARKGKAPNTSAESISFRYDWIAVMKVLLKHISQKDRIYNTDVFVNNSLGDARVNDKEYPKIDLDTNYYAEGKKINITISDNNEIASMSWTRKDDWTSWSSFQNGQSAPKGNEKGHIWVKALDSCGNGVIALLAGDSLKIVEKPEEKEEPQEEQEVNRLSEYVKSTWSTILVLATQEQIEVSSNNSATRLSLYNTKGRLVSPQSHFINGKAVLHNMDLGTGLYLLKIIGDGKSRSLVLQL